MIPALPSIVHLHWLNAMFWLHIESGRWALMTLTSIHLLIGVWLSCLGPRLTLAYGSALLTLSIFGSLMFNAAMRA